MSQREWKHICILEYRYAFCAQCIKIAMFLVKDVHL